MNLPERINAQWIDTLSDPELLEAEVNLHETFAALDRAEKARRGESYELLRGPEALTGAWMRWSMVSNAARTRGLRVGARR